MLFRPCIDLHNGQVKQIVGSSITAENDHVIENFVSAYDSAYYADLFKQKQIAGGHVIMLGPGNEQAAKEALQAYPGGLQIGGGIHADNAADFLDAGASHVIVTSYIFHDGMLDEERLRKITAAVGKERLVIDLSCTHHDGKWFVATDRWTKRSSYEVNARNLEKLAASCDEFLIHAVDVEGKRNGIQEELVSHLAAHMPITATYAGGIRSLDDIDLFRKLTDDRMCYTIGSALDLFGGDIPLDAVLEKENR
ncbi:phosphoribosylformimino-5-aminoimidazole carboxamide ribotide isomerase [Terribacillus sp. 7520-G]|uniref:phosphoribosylformimino-5-aminoimidazole carboxamide ribotide isomerase n=1 Tax=Terribacillus TaxID=459532 RepID=UPI000BA67C87|nr:phosphoribosylformimino-5-aminoimidazole carboxamide ribotide isomerase [Terribacillus sp. 7520-G]PAD40252.1 phosphoribosylformimino-5-aminoimidazole carboxamide ribotide isomerase [Terribacillus sp. 7520-G]